jgi:hypothetical protein
MMKKNLSRRNGMRWLTRLLTRRPRSESPPALWIYVACSRCGEAIRIRADRRYDLVSEMRDPGEVGPAYTLHKDIVGAQCFQRIAVDVAFDQRFQVIERRISGGRWLTEEEYQAHTTPSESPGPGV